MGGLTAVKEVQRQGKGGGQIEQEAGRLNQHRLQGRQLGTDGGPGPAQLQQVHHQKAQQGEARQPLAAGREGGQGLASPAHQHRPVAGAAVGDQFAQAETDMDQAHRQQRQLSGRQPHSRMQTGRIGLEGSGIQRRQGHPGQVQQQEQHQNQARGGCPDRRYRHPLHRIGSQRIEKPIS